MTKDQDQQASAATSVEPASSNAMPDTETPSTDRWSRYGKRLTRSASHPLFAVITALAALVIIFILINGETFANTYNARSILLNASITLVLAVGVTYVLITAGFDLSVGSVLVFSGVISVKAMTAVGGDGWTTAIVGLLAALASGACWGALNGCIVAYARLNPIIVTLGSLGAALGLAQVITNGLDLVDVPTSMLEFANSRFAGLPSIVFVALAVVIAAGIVLSKTAFGRHTYAIGSNQEAARRAGLKVERHLVAIYTFSGACAGLAAWMALARFSTTSIGGHTLDNLNAATAALLGGVSLYGGVGTVAGAAIGTFIPAVLTNGLVISDVKPYWQQVVTGFVLVAAVFLDHKRRNRD